MIIPNGTVCARIDSGGGLNAAGDPATPASAWGLPVPCRVKAIRDSELGVNDGNTFRRVSFEVLIEMQPFTASHVKLTAGTRELGEFSVMQTERLEAVRAIKIIV
jgi:hypothetical protein